MTGAGSLSPGALTRHEKSLRTLTLGAVRGAPAEGVGRDQASAAGEGFPLQTLEPD